MSSVSQISEHGFITTPYRVVENGKVTGEIVHLDATQEEEGLAAQADHIAAHIKNTIGLTATVRIVPPDTLERSAGKARRVKDRRPQM